MRVADQPQRERQIVDRVERADRERRGRKRLRSGCHSSSMTGSPPAACGEQRARIAHIDRVGERRAAASASRDPGSRSAAHARTAAGSAQAGRGNRRRRARAGTARARCARPGRAAARAAPCRTGRAHAALVRCAAVRRQDGDGRRLRFARLRRWVLDFALAAALRRLRHDRRRRAQLLRRLLDSRSSSSAIAAARPAECRCRRPRRTTCGACLAEPPRIARTRAAVAYDDLSRGLAIRLKYGRKVAIARTMARYMAPLVARR